MPKSSSSRRTRGKMKRGDKGSSDGVHQAVRCGKNILHHLSSASPGMILTGVTYHWRDSVGNPLNAEMSFAAESGAVTSYRRLLELPSGTPSSTASVPIGDPLPGDPGWFSSLWVRMRSGR